jgi:3-phenylpropionate/cinnamic acid dioxygenase small subunit
MKAARLLFALLVLLTAQTPAIAADADLVQMLADRAEIQEVAYRYINALDTRDADLYLSVFTEDAEYDVEGTIYRGHEELRGIITGLQASRDAAIAAGRPVVDLYHTNINPVIDIVSPSEARFQAYWQTLRKADDNSMRIGGMGMIKDELVKTEGKWRIKKRVLTNFVPR